MQHIDITYITNASIVGLNINYHHAKSKSDEKVVEGT